MQLFLTELSLDLLLTSPSIAFLLENAVVFLKADFLLGDRDSLTYSILFSILSRKILTGDLLSALFLPLVKSFLMLEKTLLIFVGLLTGVWTSFCASFTSLRFVNNNFLYPIIFSGLSNTGDGSSCGSMS